MSTRRDQGAAAADRLAAADELPRAVIGFDGFIDFILDAVDRRHDMSPDGYERLRTIPQLASRIGGAAGRSMNLEIVQREERWGGNGPLFAGVLGRLGASVTYIGAVGREGNHRVLHPAFDEFAARCQRIVPIAAPGRTLALEFDDGKVMLNETENVQAVTLERLIQELGGQERLIELLAPAALIGIVNWSLLGGVDGILEGLAGQILPAVAANRRGGSMPLIFIDLTDPAKRTDEDLRRVLDQLRRINALAPVTLGLNLAESERLARISGVTVAAADPMRLPDEGRIEAAALLREALDLNCIVIHQRTGAVAAGGLGEMPELASFAGPYIGRPRISTGAGDHFNGGFALAQMLRMPLSECLAVGCAVAGWYVRTAEAPDRPGLMEFLRNLPQPEGRGE
jgi:sugar/nucleoside kinase (ribokinase family)